MKFILLIHLLTYVNFLGIAQNAPKFVINGNLNGLKDGTLLYLIHSRNDLPDTIAMAKAQKQRFMFAGFIDLEPEPFWIKIDTNKTKYDLEIKGYITLFLDNSEIILEGSVYDLSLYRVKVTGSKSHNDYFDFQNLKVVKELKQYSNLVSMGGGDRDRRSDLVSRYDSIYSTYLSTMDRWIIRNPNSLYVPSLILFRSKELEYLKKNYQLLNDRIKRSNYGLKLKQVIEQMQRTAIGQVAPEFAFPTLEGDTLYLHQIIRQSKVILIDFWASWCGPCRQAFNELRVIYNKYHKKGFNIIGYSIDEKEEDWRRALVFERLPWYNIKETVKIGKQLYGFSGIPATFLINSEGRIIGKNLTIDKLDNILEQLLSGRYTVE